MKRILLALVAALALVAPVHAQDAVNEALPSLPLFASYDLDSASYTFGWYTGQGDQIWGPQRLGAAKVKTVGLSATVSAFTAATAPFAQVSVGDLLFVATSGATPGGTADGTLGRTTFMLVTAKADSDNVTVAAATATGTIDLSLGYTFRWLKFNTGTASTDGWIPMKGITAANFVYAITQQNTTTGIDYKVECKGGLDPTAITVIGPTTKTTTYGGGNVLTEPWAFCRFGIKLTSTDDGGDAGVNAEQISVTLEARK